MLKSNIHAPAGVWAEIPGNADLPIGNIHAPARVLGLENELKLALRTIIKEATRR